MIYLVDHGLGNIGSVRNALKRLYVETQLTIDPETIRTAERVILPGVGAMQPAIDRLRELNLVEVLRDRFTADKPLLGICLGMQLFLDRSEENNAAGLGFIPGVVRRFTPAPNLKIPHMGWNRLQNSHDPLFTGNRYFYFVHSYYCDPVDRSLIAAEACHGVNFAAAIRHGATLLTQFHPEKSGNAGQKLLQDWIQGA